MAQVALASQFDLYPGECKVTGFYSLLTRNSTRRGVKINDDARACERFTIR